MVYTKYNNFTLEEVILEVMNKEDPSDLELELVERIELLQEQIEDLENDLDALTQSNDVEQLES